MQAVWLRPPGERVAEPPEAQAAGAAAGRGRKARHAEKDDSFQHSEH